MWLIPNLGSDAFAEVGRATEILEFVRSWHVLKSDRLSMSNWRTGFATVDYESVVVLVFVNPCTPDPVLTPVAIHVAATFAE